MLSGPIDVDKIDYLIRDSVTPVCLRSPFRSRRLIQPVPQRSAATAWPLVIRGKTAAEMMVFARYVMFSGVLASHARAAATAMFQRAIYMLRRSPAICTGSLAVTSSRIEPCGRRRHRAGR